MTNKTKNRIEITILLIIAIAGYLYLNHLEAEYEKMLNDPDITHYTISVVDGVRYLVPVK